tara:strand:+ start:1090 stop:2094 length:1005 start_codon:yes stop_codon:yes gene_type:complete
VVRKKERIEIVPGVFVEVVNRGFGKSFKKWKKKCESFSGEDLGTKEEKGNLYEQISQHVNSQVRRANSSNSGEDGAFKVLEEVGKILEKGYQDEEELEMLEALLDALDEFKAPSSTLNPKNTLFREPQSFRTVRGKVVPKGKKVNVYGHYRTPYFEAKTGKAAKEGFYSRRANGNQQPPYHQALFGNGSGSLKLTGLYFVLEKAIEDIEENEVDLVINSLTLVNKLVKLDQLGQYINRALKTASLYTEEELSSKKLAQYLATTPLKLNPKTSEDVKRIFSLTGEVDEIFFELTPKNTRELLRRAATRNTKVPEKFVNPTTQEEVVLKWDDILKV